MREPLLLLLEEAVSDMKWEGVPSSLCFLFLLEVVSRSKVKEEEESVLAFEFRVSPSDSLLFWTCCIRSKAALFILTGVTGLGVL